MMLQYPGIYGLECSECEKWHHEIPSGKKILQGGIRAIPRGRPGQAGYTPPPCFKCPKIRPDFEEARKRLYDNKGNTIEKNRAGLMALSDKNIICYMFHKDREIFGYSDLEKSDGWVRSNAVLIKMTTDDIDKEEQKNGVAELILALYGKT